jgi:glyoxylase-like metal-dependent hydrolase (beta-lactamase superfamily II)
MLPGEVGRPPQPVLPGLWVFAPSRDSFGGTAWLLALPGRPPLLIDCPGWTAANLAFLRGETPDSPLAGEGTLLLTGREGHGRCRRWQEALGWPVLVQEQEAYLLPGVARLSRFGEELAPAAGLRLLWTPGPSPGACVAHVVEGDLDLLFCGRLLVPTAPGAAAPLRTPRTFHWPRQLRSLERLRAWLPPASPQWIASGAALGALRGERLIPGGREVLEAARG